MPATLVPWPTVSVVPFSLPRSIVRPSSSLRPFGRRLRPLPVSTAFLSWGFLMSTPVSMTATRTPLPVDCCHSSSIRTRCSDQGRPAYFLEGKVHWVASAAAAGRTGRVTKRTAVAAATVSARLRTDRRGAPPRDGSGAPAGNE